MPPIQDLIFGGAVVGLCISGYLQGEKIDKLRAENAKLRQNQMPQREPNGKFKKKP